MIEIVQDFFGWVAGLPPSLAYATIFVVAYCENLVPPLPGDVLVVFGGYLVSAGRLDPVVIVALVTVAGTLGYMTMYTFGRRIEGAIMNPDRYKWIPKQRLKRALGWVSTYGYTVVLANRFLSGIRYVITIASGMARLRFWWTTLYCGISALVWGILMVLFGYWLGENWEAIRSPLQRYSAVVVSLVLAIIIIHVIRYRRDREPEPEPEAPDGRFTDH